MAKKRFVICASDKGGIGKSFFMIQLCQWLIDANVKVRGFDPDHSHWRFSRALPDFVDQINIEESHALDNVVRRLAGEDCDVALLDGIGAEQVKTEAWIEAVDLFSAAKELDILVTFVMLIEEDMAVLEQAARLIAKFGDAVDWVFVKNPKAFKTSDATFPIWDSSRVREKAMFDLGAAEIRMPKLEAPDVNILTQSGGTIKSAINQPDLFLLTKTRFTVYGRKIDAAIAEARPSMKTIKRRALTDHWKMDGAYFMPIPQ